ncbi:hypothetical protein BHM03_00025465, partial [Ensete ventricosum]
KQAAVAMALENHFLFPYKPFLDWDPQFFTPSGNPATHFLLRFVSVNYTGLVFSCLWVTELSASESPMSSQTSTGYLQDAVAEWTDQCKRRGVASSPTHDSTATTDELQDLLHALVHSCSPFVAQDLNLALVLECGMRQFKKKKKAKVVVVHPFAVVKPGGVEGEVTLEDVNARVLMRPRRPVPHPVGEYAHGPCVSPDGPGLSGKAVVSLTRIQTQGRGTITIIRTKG